MNQYQIVCSTGRKVSLTFTDRDEAQVATNRLNAATRAAHVFYYILQVYK